MRRGHPVSSDIDGERRLPRRLGGGHGAEQQCRQLWQHQRDALRVDGHGRLHGIHIPLPNHHGGGHGGSRHHVPIGCDHLGVWRQRSPRQHGPRHCGQRLQHSGVDLPRRRGHPRERLRGDLRPDLDGHGRLREHLHVRADHWRSRAHRMH